jgi:3-hydroxyisobutyrate dehydrogenase-like beta-hydroxyacid dehydrogenase
MATAKIGVVGLGKMGSSFARRLLEQHYAVSVWDRSPQAVTAFNVAGSVPCDSLASLAGAVDVIIVMLWGDQVAREVTLAEIIPAMHRSQILIEMSTLSPQMYETLEKAAGDRDVDFVASPVLGNPDAARQGLLTVLPGGNPETVQRVRDILASLGTVIEMPSVRAAAISNSQTIRSWASSRRRSASCWKSAIARGSIASWRCARLPAHFSEACSRSCRSCSQTIRNHAFR